MAGFTLFFCLHGVQWERPRRGSLCEGTVRTQVGYGSLHQLEWNIVKANLLTKQRDGISSCIRWVRGSLRVADHNYGMGLYLPSSLLLEMQCETAAIVSLSFSSRTEVHVTPILGARFWKFCCLGDSIFKGRITAHGNRG